MLRFTLDDKLGFNDNLTGSKIRFSIEAKLLLNEDLTGSKIYYEKKTGSI